MDWYYGSGMNDYLVPEDQDLLDRHPSPDNWSNWGISVPEDFVMDTNAVEVDFNFIDESFSNEIDLESSLHDKDQSSSSSVYGGLPEQSFQQAALSCDQPNYHLQDLSRFEQMDDIFLYKQLYKNEPVIAWDSVLEDLPCVESLHKSFNFYPENKCSNTPGGLHLQKDIAVHSNSNSEDCLDIECSGDETMHEQSSLEVSILQDLEMITAQFTEKTRICFRDALYRLAKNTKQQHVVEDQDGDLNMQDAMPQAVHSETVRSEDKKPLESETNRVDRAVASLLFNKMEINISSSNPFTTQ